jgi:magnesium chelatase family protein
MVRQGCLNSRLSGVQLDAHAPIDDRGRSVLRDRLEHDRLSARGYHRVRRVARTIADLRPNPTDEIGEPDIQLALRLRSSFGDALRIGRAA